MAPRLVSPAHVFLDLQPGGRATVHYRATWEGLSGRRTLSWTGRGIRAVSVENSARSPSSVYGSDRAVLVRLPRVDPGAALKVDIRYEVELEALSDQVPGLRWLSIDNIPTLRSRLLTAPPVGTRSPWREEPDLVVTLGSPPSWDIVGPRYVARPSDGSLGPRSIALYSGERTAYALVGDFAQSGASLTTSVLVPTPQRDEVDVQLVETLAGLSTEVQRHFRDLFGPPPVDPRTVIGFRGSAGEASYSVGSAVVINTGRRGTHLDTTDSLVALRQTIAHELAHSWWAYGTVWSDRRTAHAIDEALAIFLAWDAVLTLGGESAAREADGWMLGWAQETARRGVRHGDPHDVTAGVSAARLLRALRECGRDAVMLGLRTLWDEAQRETLTLDSLQDALGGTAGTSLAASLRDPRPIVARVRVHRRTSADTSTLEVRPRRGDVRRLRQRLDACPIGPARYEGKTVSFVCGSADDLHRRLYALEHCHIVLQRVRREARLVANGLLRGSWRWATQGRSAAQATPVDNATRGLLAVLLNPDHPCGFARLYFACAQAVPALARAFACAAGMRAIYSWEASVRKLSEVDRHVREV